MMPLEIRNLLNSCHDLKFTDLPYLCNRTPGDNHRLGVARFIGDILNFNTITQMHAVMHAVCTAALLQTERPHLS